MTLKVLSEKDKQEIREVLKRWCVAAKATAERDPEFKETLARTPFYSLVMTNSTTQRQPSSLSNIEGDEADL